MAIPLPEKIYITGVDVDPDNFRKEEAEVLARLNVAPAKREMKPDDLTTTPDGGARKKYDDYYVERARRADPTQPGVANEALDALADCKANKRSTEELHRLGYSYHSTVKPAQNEEKRVVQQLKSKASKDVTSPFFSAEEVGQVMTKHDIAEFKPKAVEPEPIPE